MNNIKTQGKDHFLHENQTWSRALDFYLQENSYLKTRLSQVVDSDPGSEFVPVAEQFNNNFIQNDEYINDLKKDVLDLGQILKRAVAGSETDESKLLVKQKKLRNEMQHFEKKFVELKNIFNQYLVSDSQV
jgi:hypothetical protein